ncbi:TIGR01777 family oxidoreductase [Allokutzneria sp. A3M-2-11 16]|uniref:TIGR01777 family oxidoreductase n=1 Tax=Allokutzneria sp. A3M-2-11 16 TaxID=2962043 RepID=UPI0020B812B8|nr:TIGR01777 family oxidoreductase [Allokutzneria sp. A3M-2-11 16]MCP3801819.1 TIGR01777 family oxidoreductase [Allokutzneria sp. A3M-2-11 16]
MRVVIAGSSGLIGSALIPVLRQAGHEVLRLVRRRPAAPDERGWDPYAGRLDEGALDGADAVVNLCGAGIGERRWTEERKRALITSRIVPTRLLAEAVAERKVPTLVNGSAVGFYGDTGSRVVDETATAGEGFLADLCEQWEHTAERAMVGGSRVAMVRTGLVLSPAGGLLGQLRPLFSLMLGGRLGSGQQYMPWISLDDEVGAIRFVLENEAVSGPVNLTGPLPATNAEFTAAFGKVLGRPAPWMVPGFALRLALGGFADEGALIGQRAVPAVLERTGYEFQHPTLEAALDAAEDR